MATLREIKRRIAGVRSTAKITQAMKMVAAAKLRRAQDSINAARPYARALESLLKDLLQSASLESAQSPLLIGRPQDDKERVVLVVVTSDRETTQTELCMETPGLLRFARNDRWSGCSMTSL